MNSSKRKLGLRLSVRGTILTLTYLFICLTVWILTIELSAIASLKSQLADIEQSRVKVKNASRNARQLEQVYNAKRTEAYYHERHITELIQTCRNIGEMPNLNSEFIVCEDPKNDPFSCERWIYIPEGKHELQLRFTEYEGSMPKGPQLVSYALLPKSAYKLDFQFLPASRSSATALANLNPGGNRARSNPIVDREQQPGLHGQSRNSSSQILPFTRNTDLLQHAFNAAVTAIPGRVFWMERNHLPTKFWFDIQLRPAAKNCAVGRICVDLESRR